MTIGQIRSHTIPKPPRGYVILVDPKGMTKAGDLKWCPVHQRWEPVNMDYNGAMMPGDFAPIHSYLFIARSNNQLYYPKGQKNPIERLVHDDNIPLGRKERARHYPPTGRDK